MRYFDQGAFYRVTVTETELDAFKRRWPCHGISARRASFTFDKDNGDLVDVWPSSLGAADDGPAVVALVQDAQAYGAKRAAPAFIVHARKPRRFATLQAAREFADRYCQRTGNVVAITSA